jgi:hypothetical protein
LKPIETDYFYDAMEYFRSVDTFESPLKLWLSMALDVFNLNFTDL